MLPLARYRFHWRVSAPIHLPAYAGSMLREAFGHALRRLACMTRQADCAACSLLHTCPYPGIFAPPPVEHSLQRFSQMPDLPTIAEAGVPGYESVIWFGITTTAGTPPEIVSKLSQEMNRILKLPANREKFAAYAIDLTPNTPEEFGAMIKSEVAKWSKLLKDVGIKPE